MSACAGRGAAVRRARRVVVALVPALLLVLAAAIHCGASDPSSCPLRVPTNEAFCNSGGVVVYCHYGCTPDAGTTYYATCSGPRWTVVASGVDCSRDAETD